MLTVSAAVVSQKAQDVAFERSGSAAPPAGQRLVRIGTIGRGVAATAALRFAQPPSCQVGPAAPATAGPSVRSTAPGRGSRLVHIKAAASRAAPRAGPRAGPRAASQAALQAAPQVAPQVASQAAPRAGPQAAPQVEAVSSSRHIRRPARTQRGPVVGRESRRCLALRPRPSPLAGARRVGRPLPPDTPPRRPGRPVARSPQWAAAGAGRGAPQRRRRRARPARPFRGASR
eukprot:scaffold32214_cov61-Phaeocystis_antarctica.AAC.4